MNKNFLIAGAAAAGGLLLLWYHNRTKTTPAGAVPGGFRAGAPAQYTPGVLDQLTGIFSNFVPRTIFDPKTGTTYDVPAGTAPVQGECSQYVGIFGETKQVCYSGPTIH